MEVALTAVGLVAVVAGLVLVVALMKVAMDFHIHQWSQVTAHPVETYEKETDKRPVRIETHVSGVCKVCQKPLSKKVDGDWRPGKQ